MSITTWKEEFYPVPASSVPKEMSARHSLKKWQGLLPENMKRHKVKRVVGGWMPDSAIEDKDGWKFEFCGATCALCENYQIDTYSNPDDDDICRKCPLFKVLGRACDNSTEDKPSPWHAFSHKNNPKPMIEALTKTAEIEREASEKRAARAKTKSTTATRKKSRKQPKRSASV